MMRLRIVSLLAATALLTCAPAARGQSLEEHRNVWWVDDASTAGAAVPASSAAAPAAKSDADIDAQLDRIDQDIEAEKLLKQAESAPVEAPPAAAAPAETAPAEAAPKPATRAPKQTTASDKAAQAEAERAVLEGDEARPDTKTFTGRVVSVTPSVGNKLLIVVRQDSGYNVTGFVAPEAGLSVPATGARVRMTGKILRSSSAGTSMDVTAIERVGGSSPQPSRRSGPAPRSYAPPPVSIGVQFSN